MTPQEIQSLVAGIVAQTLKGGVPKAAKAPAKKAKGKKGKGRKPLTDAEKAVFMARNDAEAVTAFTAAGYKDVKPRENVLTYGKWGEKGRLVKKGEKAVRVGPFNLFHFDQTEPAQAVIGA